MPPADPSRPPLDDLSRAQQSVSRAVARARVGEDADLAQRVRERGEALASVLAGLLKLSRVHAADNRAFDAPLAELVRALGQLVELLGTVHLLCVEDQVFVNEVRVRSDAVGVRDLGDELARHNAGGLSFHDALSVEGARALMAALARPPPDHARRLALQQALAGTPARAVEPTARQRFLAQGEDGAARRAPVETLRRVLALAEETYDNQATGRVLNVLPLRRAVAEIIDLGPATPELWEGGVEALPHASHAVSVTMVALLVGKAAGMAGGALQDLGLAALLHDVGYAGLPAEVAPGPEGLARHPAEGARMLLRQRGFHLGKLRRLRAVLDHHRDHADPLGPPSALGQVLRLAEDYATLLRVYAGRISPADALGAIARAAGRLYHPALAQVMVNVLGRYPPGTLLELEDGRLARSVAPVRSPETFAAPLVRLVDPGTRAVSAVRHDLAESRIGVRRALPG